jgi:hypothetical protein
MYRTKKAMARRQIELKPLSAKATSGTGIYVLTRAQPRKAKPYEDGYLDIPVASHFPVSCDLGRSGVVAAIGAGRAEGGAPTGDPKLDG